MARVPIEGTYTVVDNVVTFNPTGDLPAETEIFVELTNGIRSLDNERLAASVNLSFITAAAAGPAVMTMDSSSPADQATEVALSAVIEMNFSANINAATAIADNIIVKDINTDEVIPGSFSVTNAKITFTPTDPFENNQYVEVTVTTYVQGTNGEELAEDVAFSFITIGGAMTIDSTDPEDEDIDVAVGSNIEITFQEGVVIDENTVDENSFIVEYDDGL